MNRSPSHLWRPTRSELCKGARFVPLTRRLLCLLALALLSTLALSGALREGSGDQEAAVPRLVPPAVHLPADTVGRIRRLHRLPRRSSRWGTVTSSNWAGYAATGSTFTSVKASWVVPAIQASSSTTYAAFWVGLDGYSSSTVEQTGTLAESNHGSVSYYAWYEMYPAAMVTVGGMTITPGDQMTATVTTGGTGSFTLTLVDDTTNASFATTQTGNGAALSSAEVIAEAPSSGSSILPLANFGTASFTSSAFNGQLLSSFGSSELEQIDMTSGSTTIASTSVLGSDGASFSVTSYPSATSSPVNVSLPAISGTPAPGDSLSCSSGSWTGNPTPTYSYQWLRDATPISGANSSSYSVQTADQGHSLSCRVTATNSAGQQSATSAAVQVPAATSSPLNVSLPAISGSPALGDSLSCSSGGWTGSPTPTYSYQWLRDATPISGAGSSSYTVQTADQGRSLSCRVTATNSAGQQSATSAAVQVPAATSSPLNVSLPAISGTPAPGDSLSCSSGSWTGNPTPTYSYQWLRDATPISGANSSSYSVQTADQGHSLSCRVTATNSAGQQSATSSAAQVPAATSVVPAHKVSVTPSLGLKATLRSVRSGWIVTLRGTVKYYVATDRVVRIWRRLNGKLIPLKKLKITSSGAFGWEKQVTKTGNWVFVASYAVGKATYLSKPVTVTVRKPAHHSAVASRAWPHESAAK